MEVLYKYGEGDHISQLKKGKLYCNSLQYFKDIEQDTERGDPHEGNIKLFYPNNDPQMEITLEFINGKIQISPSDVKDICLNLPESPSHIFCFSLFEIELLKQSVLPNLFQADSIILFQSEFLNSIKENLRKQSIKHKIIKIEYVEYDKKTVFNKNWATKHIKYKNQNEVRLAIWDQPIDKPFILDFIPKGTCYVADVATQSAEIFVQKDPEK